MENEVTYTMPRIGDKAPSFKAKTTQGDINFPEDFKENGSYCLATRPTLHRFALRNL